MIRGRKIVVLISFSNKNKTKAKIRSKMMDMEEVYLRQITEYLKRQTELQEKNNDLLKELLQNLSN